MQGSVAAMAVTVPLDTVRMRLLLDDESKSRSSAQLVIQILREEGM